MSYLTSLCVCVVLDDVRHDVYLTLMHGLFNKGTKRADKNVEISMEVIDEKEQVIEVSILSSIMYTSPSCPLSLSL